MADLDKTVEKLENLKESKMNILGFKFTPVTLGATIAGIGSFIGTLYVGFTMWNTFQSMEAFLGDFVEVEEHMVMVTSELQLIEEEFKALKEVDGAMNEVVTTQVNSLKEMTGQLQGDMHDIKMELREDVAKVQDMMDKQDERNRGNVDTVRDLLNTFDLKMSEKIDRFETKVEGQMNNLDENLNKKIQRALDNPLAGN